MRRTAQLSTIVALLVAASTAVDEQVKVGDLTSYAHGVKGTLYTMGDKKLVLKGFQYDGAGPDAFFLVGTEGKPGDAKDGTILPHPFSGKFFEFTDPEAPIIQGRFDGNQPDIVLTLPDNLKISDLKWFKVYCRAFTVNFADISFPTEGGDSGANKTTSAQPSSSSSAPTNATTKGQKEDKKADSDLPPPLLSNNVHSHHDRHNAHGDTPDEAYPEPEGEPESEPEKAGALANYCTWPLMAAAAIAVASSWSVSGL